MGFTRVRVLIICPFRSVAHDIVQTILKLMPKRKPLNLERFEQEFGDDGEPLTKNDSERPPDWIHLFKGNNDDRFKIGVSVGKKAVRLFAPFNKSDILIASPLGLREIV